jgi:hypothetical protein
MVPEFPVGRLAFELSPPIPQFKLFNPDPAVPGIMAVQGTREELRTVAIAMLSFDTVRTLGLSLPDVVDGTAYGFPALKLGGKLLACIPANKSAEANSIVVRIDLEQRAELLREHPEIYYITDHYAPHPTVLVRLSKITRADLKELLRDACHFASRRRT